MADVRPFRALRPRADQVAQIIAPPYDVLSSDEVRELLNPMSFLHVTRSEVDLEPDIDPHCDIAWKKARENLEKMVESGILVEDTEPALYVYKLRRGTHVQSGFIAACSVEAYDRGDIRKHEHTRPDKEEDRANHMEALDAQVGLVFLAYRNTPELQRLLIDIQQQPPLWDVTTEDGIQHVLYRITGPSIDEISTEFLKVYPLYIADGHHRTAAASRVHAHRKTEASAWFIAGLYPEDQLQILPYHRVVSDSNGHSEAEILQRLDSHFEISETTMPLPEKPGSFGLYLGGRWRRLTCRNIPDDPIAGLDVSLLQNDVLQPIFGIDNPRTSSRIQFVGGSRPTRALEQMAGTNGIAFAMYPTSMRDLFRVADAGEVMPPKSTWFEPKLREGVVSRWIY